MLYQELIEGQTFRFITAHDKKSKWIFRANIHRIPGIGIMRDAQYALDEVELVPDNDGYWPVGAKTLVKNLAPSQVFIFTNIEFEEKRPCVVRTTTSGLPAEWCFLRNAALSEESRGSGVAWKDLECVVVMRKWDGDYLGKVGSDALEYARKLHSEKPKVSPVAEKALTELAVIMINGKSDVECLSIYKQAVNLGNKYPETSVNLFPIEEGKKVFRNPVTGGIELDADQLSYAQFKWTQEVNRLSDASYIKDKKDKEISVDIDWD